MLPPKAGGIPDMVKEDIEIILFIRVILPTCLPDKQKKYMACNQPDISLTGMKKMSIIHIGNTIAGMEMMTMKMTMTRDMVITRRLITSLYILSPGWSLMHT
jgi:hypothetical protein